MQRTIHIERREQELLSGLEGIARPLVSYAAPVLVSGAAFVATLSASQVPLALQASL